MASKKYFARHLELPDEPISIGDKIRSESHGNFPVEVTGFTKEGDYVTSEQELADPMGGSYYVVKKSNASKLSKLFLFSRDVKAGDTLKECLPDGIAKKVHHFEAVLPHGVYVFEPWPSENESWIHAHLAFKLVAEVSPWALKYVIEGDEFNDEDVDLFWWNSLIKNNPSIRYIEATKDFNVNSHGNIDTSMVVIAMIKGPCGHFH